MKNRVKQVLAIIMIFVGAMLFDITPYKLTGVMILILGFALDWSIEDEEGDENDSDNK